MLRPPPPYTAGLLRAASPAPERIIVYATSRDYLMLCSSYRSGERLFSWEAPDHNSVAHLVEYLGNDALFPRARPRVLELHGTFPAATRDAIAAGVRRHGMAVRDVPDPLSLVAEGGPASVVWVADPAYAGVAAWWAHRAETVYRERYTVLTQASDYERLEAAGAIVPSVVSFGGQFPLARRRPGWLVNGKGVDGAAAPAVPAGIAEELATDRAVRDEVGRMYRLLQSILIQQGGPGADSPPQPPSGSPVDIVFHSPYAQNDIPAKPLSFFGTATIAGDYANRSCPTQPLGYCHPNAVVDLVEYRLDNDFQTRCNPNTPYNAATIGYDCKYDETNPDPVAAETNFFDKAVKDKVKERLDFWKASPTFYTIRNVVIVSHWLDIPYRERLFPYIPSYDLQRNYYSSGTPNTSDADWLWNDHDNDMPSPCTFQNSSAGHPGACTDNTWPTAKDPDASDNHYEGDAGSLDYYLADFHNDFGNAPYGYAHAGYGRITGHSSSEMTTLITTGQLVIDGTSPAPGATAVYGAPGVLGSGEGYADFTNLMLCRYAGDVDKIQKPCATWICANEMVGCGTPPSYTPDAFYDTADGYGEIVVAAGHNVDVYYADRQQNLFRSTALCGQPDPVMISSSTLDVYTAPGGGFEPGVWTVTASNCFGYAWLDPNSPCDNGHPCEPGGCTQACLQSYKETSFASELIAKGVLAVRGSFAGHGDVSVKFATEWAPSSWLREVSQGTKLGIAFRISVNEPRVRWAEDPSRAYEVSTMLLGDPLAGLPAPPGCANTPGLVVGKGPEPQAPAGEAIAMGVSQLGVPMPDVVSFDPFPGSSPYGNTVASGNLDVQFSDLTDEIVVARGPGPSNDTLVKVLDERGSSIASFYAFPGQTAWGANLAVGNVRDMTGRMDIVTGQGHGSPFAPQVRIHSWSCSPLPCGFKASASFDAYPGLSVGVSVGAGNFDTADTMDELITGLGPVSAAGSDLVKIWNADGTPSLRYSFNAWGSNTWGTNVGSADGLETGAQAGRDTPVVGKGPGDQVPVPPYSTIMDEDVRLFRYRPLSDAYTVEVTIDDPWVAFILPWIDINGAFAGARARGFQADADVEEEIAIARGPVSLESGYTYTQPPSFRGSVLKAFDVDTSGPTWTYDTVPVWSTVVFPEDEPQGQPTTRGLQVARLRSTADLKGQYAFGPSRGTVSAGSSGFAEEPPVDPSRGAGVMAEEDLATFAGAAEGLFEEPRWKASLLERLGGVRDDMASGATAGALSRVADLAAWLPGAVRNAGTEAELVDRARRLGRAIEQQIANRPPVPVLEDPPVYDVPWGEPIRVPLSASRSTDPDSTPGTSDNIVSYRWYHEGRLVDDRAEALVELRHDGVSPVSTHTVVLEIEDAYGGRATAAQVVRLRGIRSGTP